MPEHGAAGLGPDSRELDVMVGQPEDVNPGFEVKMITLDPKCAQQQLNYRCIEAHRIRPSSILKSDDRDLLELENELVRALAGMDKKEAQLRARNLETKLASMLTTLDDKDSLELPGSRSSSAVEVAHLLVSNWAYMTHVDKARGYKPKGLVTFTDVSHPLR